MSASHIALIDAERWERVRRYARACRHMASLDRRENDGDPVPDAIYQDCYLELVTAEACLQPADLEEGRP